MKRSRFTDRQIIAILKPAEAGTPVPVLCQAHGINSASFYICVPLAAGTKLSTGIPLR